MADCRMDLQSRGRQPVEAHLSVLAGLEMGRVVV